MMFSRALALLIAVTACKAQLASPPNSGDDEPAIDAPLPSEDDAPIADAPAPLGPWSAPMPVPGASNAAVQEDDAVLGPDGLELIFALAEADGKHLYRMTRQTIADAWSMPEQLAISLGATNDQTPRLSTDGKTLYFASTRANGVGNLDIYTATRAALGEPFGNVTIMPGVNDVSIDRWFSPCAGGGFFISERGGDADEDVFEYSNGAASRLAVGSVNNERGLSVTPDCLTIYFGSNQSGEFQLYQSTRTTTAEPFPDEARFTELDVMGAAHEDPFISADGRTFLFTASVNGNKDVYISTR